MKILKYLMVASLGFSIAQADTSPSTGIKPPGATAPASAEAAPVNKPRLSLEVPDEPEPHTDAGTELLKSSEAPKKRNLFDREAKAKSTEFDGDVGVDTERPLTSPGLDSVEVRMKTLF